MYYIFKKTGLSGQILLDDTGDRLPSFTIQIVSNDSATTELSMVLAPKINANKSFEIVG